MLNKHNMNVAQFASKDQSRFAITNILVEERATVATNGHYLMWVSEDSVEPSSFPIVPGFGPAAGEERKRFLLDRESALAIAKAVPNGKTLPVLSHVAVKTETNVENGETQGVLAVTDLERPQVFHPKPSSGQFPNYQAVIPDWDKAKWRISVDASYLAQIAKAFASFVESRGSTASQTVVLSFYGEQHAMRFDGTRDGQGMTAVLMPVRDNTDKAGTYGQAERKAKAEAEAEAKKQAEANAKLAEAEANAA